MAIKVRDADLQTDRNELIQFLRENLTEQSDALRFDWLYLQNPNGPARAWMAIDEASGRTVGVAGAFPRTVCLNGRTRRAYVLGDFCIAPECRSLGPALSLQRACLNDIHSNEYSVWLDFPSDRMVAIYRRLGIETAGNIIRYVKLLRIDEKVRSRMRQPALASGISAVGNLALRFQVRRQSLPADLVIGIHEGPFGEEFTKLNLRAASFYPSHGLRPAEYLNWRYLQNPLSKHHVIAARRGAELAGYAVVTAGGSEWRLSDLFVDDKRAIAGLLGHVQSLARKQRIEKLTAFVTEGSSFAVPLKEAGFYARETHPIIMYAEDGGSTLVQNTKNWFLMDGDRES